MIVEYRVLGPLEVLRDGEPVALPAGRGRVLLATLLLRANEFVTVDELVDRVWDGEPPEGDRAYKTLHMTVSRLRQALGAANCIRTSSRGYSAEVAPGQLDLARFRALTAQGEHRAALELWRGPVLANVTSEALHRDDVPRLVEEQVVALERRIDQDLSRDAHPFDQLVDGHKLVGAQQQRRKQHTSATGRKRHRLTVVDDLQRPQHAVLDDHTE